MTAPTIASSPGSRAAWKPTRTRLAACLAMFAAALSAMELSAFTDSRAMEVAFVVGGTAACAPWYRRALQEANRSWWVVAWAAGAIALALICFRIHLALARG